MEPNQDTLRQILSGGMTQSELMNRTEEEQMLEMIEMLAKLMGQGEASGIGHSLMDRSDRPNRMPFMPIDSTGHDAINSLINAESSGLLNFLLGRNQNPFE